MTPPVETPVPPASRSPSGEAEQRIYPSVWLTLVAGVALSIAIFLAVKSREEQRALEDFERRALAQHLIVSQTLEKYAHLLASVQRLHDATPSAMTNEVNAAAELLRTQGLPLLSLQWTPRVLHAQRAGFEAELRQLNVGRPEIRRRTGPGEWAAVPAREDYFPRRYSSPMTAAGSLGADLGDDAVHGPAMRAARDSGEPTLDLRVGSNQLPTFVFVLPIYGRMEFTMTVEHRRAALRGFLLAYVRSAELGIALSQIPRSAGVELSYTVPANRATNAVLHFIPGTNRAALADEQEVTERRAGPHRELPTHLASLPLTFLYRPAPDWLAAQRTLYPHGTLLSFIGLTGLAAGFVHTLHRRRAAVEAEVVERTATLKSTAEQLRESERLYHSLVQNLPQFVFRKDRAGRFTFVNDNFAASLGHRAEDILGRTDADLFPAELAAQFRADDERLMTSGVPFEAEERTALGARVQFVRLAKTPLRDEAGTVVGLQGIAWDITERHQMTEALRRSEGRFRTFMNNIPGPAWLKDDELRLAYVNSAFEQLFQRAAGDLLGKSDPDYLPPAVAAETRANDLAVIAANTPREVVEQVPDAEGRLRHWLVVKFPFEGPSGRPWIGGIAFDVTARIEAVNALAAREEQMRLFVQHTPAAVAMLDREMRYLVVSERWRAANRIGTQEIIGRSHYEVLPEIPEPWKAVHRRCLTGAVERHDEDAFPRADGTTDWVRWQIHPWRERNGEIGGLILFTEVVTERRLARQAIERRDAVLGAVARSAETLVRAEPEPEALAQILAAIGTATSTSRVFLFEHRLQPNGELLAERRADWRSPALPDARQGLLWEPVHYREAGLARWADELTAGRVISGLTRDFPPAEQALLGREHVRSLLLVPVFAGARCWGVLGLNECHEDRVWTQAEADAMRVAAGTLGAGFERHRVESERQNIERKMVESQKLESLGVLAGGIAHDFNNLLTGILGNASLLRMDLPLASPLLGSVDQIEKTALRAAELCKQMLAYSGKGRFQLQRLDLARLVEDTTHLLQISISKKVVLKFNFAPGLPPVEADATQLRQIVMNLVINASEAIGDRSGIIALTTGLTRVDRQYLTTTYLAPELPEGDYIFLEVSDNGCGMPPEIKARIFDPFYTTKFTGRGLGLAAVLGIVHGHRGALKVYSEPGKGSSFKIILPIAAGLPTYTGESPGSVTRWRSAGRILVVDDEETVRAVAARLLESLGFQVTLAEDGRAGVAAFEREPDAFRLVLMDLTMPHHDGVQAFSLMRRVRPEVKVILMSGFNEQDAIANFTGKGLAGFLQKPYDLATLTERLRTALGEPA